MKATHTPRTDLSGRLSSLVGCEVPTAVAMKSTIFWRYNEVSSVDSQLTFRRDISSPSSGYNRPSEIRKLKQMASKWYLIRFSRWRWFSSETSVDFQRTTRPYIPKDNTLYVSLRLTGLRCMHFSFSPYVIHAHPINLPWFHHSDNIWRPE
jgi:hypothetical protein